MTRHILFWGCLVVSMGLGDGNRLQAWAEAQTTQPKSQIVISVKDIFQEMMNMARENPLAMAESFGLDRETLLEKLPDMQDILLCGLPPLSFEEKLSGTAISHTTRMFEYQFYSSVDVVDGSSCSDRIAQNGYDAVYTGEAIGMIQFLNYISPEEAARLVFESLFTDELNPERTEQRYILNPEFSCAGVGFAAGVMDVGMGSANSYLVTCDFASIDRNSLTLLEKQILNCINQLRARPRDVLLAMGFDPGLTLRWNPALETVFNEGLPPLLMHQGLQNSVVEHVDEMVRDSYLSVDALDGRTPQERVLECGFDIHRVREDAKEMVVSHETDTAEIATAFLQQVLQYSLLFEEQDRHTMFSPDFRLAGVAVSEKSVMETEPESGEDIYVIAVDYGDIEIDSIASPAICGMVFADTDGSALYEPGEGLSDILITVYNSDGAIENEVISDESGAWSLTLEPGEYTLFAVIDNVEYVYPVSLIRDHVYVDFMR